MQQGLHVREHEVEADFILRLERLEEDRGLLFGEMTRMQMSNLPSEAQRGQPIRALGVASIGHSTVFAYDPNRSMLALQLARNGITSTRMGLYVEAMCGGAKFDLLPVPNERISDALERGRVRALRVRVAHPQTLEAADVQTQSVTRGFQAFRAALGTPNIDVTLSMARGEPDISKEGVLSLFSWFRRQKDQSPGSVDELRASVIQPGTRRMEWLDLLEGQMGSKRRIDLPADDPDGSYAVRKGFAEGILDDHRAAFEARRE